MDASLKQIKFILQDILNHFDWRAEQVLLHQTQYIKLSELNTVRKVINDVSTLDLFDDAINYLKSSVIFTSSTDQMNIQLSEGQIIISNLNQLKILLTNFLNLLIKTVPNEDESSVNIKLPPVNDFDELSKVSRDIHVGLSQVIFNDEIGGQSKIVSVENGSIWINVFLGAKALSVIASVVWSASVIFKKIQEGRMMEQQIRALKIKNDSLEEILRAQKAEIDLMIQAEAEHIESEHFTNNVPENIERIKKSISTFAELISKGAEVHPSLVASESISNLFPDPKKFLGLESKIKKLKPSSDT